MVQRVRTKLAPHRIAQLPVEDRASQRECGRVRRRILVSIACHWPALTCAVLIAQPIRAQVVDLRAAQLPLWRLEEDLRIGSVDGPNDAFVRPATVTIDAAGRIYVLDAGLPALSVFDSGGRFIRQYGRRGEGPGEYVSPAAFGVQGDTIWLSDARTGRITYYDQRGEVLESFQLNIGAPDEPLRIPVRALGADVFLVISPPGPDLRRLPVGPAKFRQSILRVRRNGAVIDTLVFYESEFPAIVTAPGAVFAYQPIRDGVSVSYSAESDLIREVHRRASQTGGASEFRIVFRTRSGEIVKEQAYRYRPLELRESVRDSLLAEAHRRLSGASGVMKEVALRHLYLPRFQPPTSTGLINVGDGSYWIQRESFPMGSTQYLVIDPDLRALARVQAPEKASRLLTLSEEYAWFLLKGALDVPFVVRYKIRKEY